MTVATRCTADGIQTSATATLFAIAGLGGGSTYGQPIVASEPGDRFLFNLVLPDAKPTTMTVALHALPQGIAGRAVRHCRC